MKFSDLKKDTANKDNSVITSSDEKIKNLEIILNIVNSINSSLILEDVLELVLKYAIKLTGSDRGFVVLKNLEGKLEYKLGIDSQNNFLNEDSFNVSTTVVEDVFNTGQSKFIEGAQSDTNHDPSKSILRLELQTILCSDLTRLMLVLLWSKMYLIPASQNLSKVPKAILTMIPVKVY